MTSQYLKCDECGAVLDRWPARLNRGDGTFGKVMSREAIDYAASLGWLMLPGAMPGEQRDYCPDCRFSARYPNGQPMFAPDGMMLDEHGNRSIFDDVDD